jgi:septum formation protein
MRRDVRIILASGSPRRKELLKLLGLDFTVIPAEGEEQTHADAPADIVQDLALRKAQEVYDRSAVPAGTEPESDVLVIGSDTVVARDRTILGKPADEEDAYRMLSMLQNRVHQVYTGVALLGQVRGRKVRRIFYESVDVTFYPMTDREIRDYIHTGEPMDKAGSYGIQGGGGLFVKSIRGDYNTVVGLPAARLYQELKEILL